MGKNDEQSLPPLEVAQNIVIPPESESRNERMVRLAGRLLQIGVSGHQVRRLLLHDLDKVERQLDWLPYRSARKKASLIVAAIEQDYEAPANWEAHEES